MISLSIMTIGSLLWISAPQPRAVAVEALPLRIEIDEEIEALLRQDPAVMLAQASLEKARAELLAARYEATLRILGQRQELRELQQRREIVRGDFERVRHLVDNGNVSQAELARAELELLKIDGQEQALRLRMRPVEEKPMLTDVTDQVQQARFYPRPLIAAAMRAQLSVEVTFPNVAMDLDEWLKGLSQVSGVSFLLSNELKQRPIGKVLLGGGPTFTVGNAMLALADQFELAFVQRDYGWILLRADRARELAGAAVPQDLPCTNPGPQPAPNAAEVEALDDLGPVEAQPKREAGRGR